MIDFFQNVTSCFFDMDGTLIDSIADIRSAWKSTMLELGLENPDFDRIFFPGPSLDQMASMLFPEETEDTLARLKQTFRLHYDGSDFPGTVPYPWIPGWLKELRSSGKKLFLITNKRPVPVDFLLEKFGWTDLLEDVRGRECSYPAGKAEMLEQFIEKHSIVRENAVMVGDTTEDIAAGKKSGIRTCAVLWGYGKEKDLIHFAPDFSLDQECFTAAETEK